MHVSLFPSPYVDDLIATALAADVVWVMDGNVALATADCLARAAIRTSNG